MLRRRLFGLEEALWTDDDEILKVFRIQDVPPPHLDRRVRRLLFARTKGVAGLVSGWRLYSVRFFNLWSSNSTYAYPFKIDPIKDNLVIV